MYDLKKDLLDIVEEKDEVRDVVELVSAITV